jgi:hypothetical protein
MLDPLRKMLESLVRRRPSDGPKRDRAWTSLKIEALEDRLVPSTTNAVICGFVYNDVNHNGTFDTGDVGIGGNTIQLYDLNDKLIATTQTDASGQYSFSVDQTIDTSPTTKEFDSTFADQRTSTTRTQTVAQFDPSLGTLTGVEIINDSTLTANASLESLDSAAATDQAELGGDTTLTVNGRTVKVAVSATETANLSAFDGTLDFGGTSGTTFPAKQMSGSNSVMLDSSTSDLSSFVGTGSVSLNLSTESTSCACGTGNLASLITTSAQANIRVIYHYIPSNALKPGTYLVVQPSNPPGFIDGQNTLGDGTVIPPSNGTEYLPVTVGTGVGGVAVQSCNNDFGEIQAATISGYAYFDANLDTYREAGEWGLGGVTIQLTGVDVNGQAVSRMTQTDANGQYSFTDLTPGTYTLTKLTTPAGFLDWVDRAGNLGGTAGVDTITNIQLQGGANGVEYDFGHVAPSSVSGYVYFDANKDGVLDSGDTGIAGVTITLYGTDGLGRAVQMSTVTNAYGYYSFGNLIPGSYALTKTPPAGYLDGATNVGTLGGTAVGNTIYFSLDAQFVQGLYYNFGEVVNNPGTTFTPNTGGGGGGGGVPTVSPQTTFTGIDKSDYII